MELNKPTIITGCHRSGTTLLGLMLDSHPRITTVDEDKFDNSKLGDYLEHPAYGPNVVFKLPAEAISFRAFKVLPGLKVFWSLRDPRDTVLSLYKLRWVHESDAQPVSMCIHDMGGMHEIGRFLAEIDPQCTHPGIAEYARIRAIPQEDRTRRDAIMMSALYWELKNMLPDLYVAEGVPTHVVRYEKLISEPRAVLEQALGFLGVAWHDDVLRHHELHSGKWAGSTMGDRAIDAGNAGKWKSGLSPEDVDVVEAYCAQGMARFGYAESGERHVMPRSTYRLAVPGAR